MKPQELNLKCEALEEFMTNLEAALKIVTMRMMERKMQTGTVSAKIEVELKEMPTADGEILTMIEIKPDVKVKIGSKASLDCEKQGGMFIRQDDYGAPIVGSCQVDIDELISRERGA